MAHQPYKLEILTPEGHVFSGDVEFVSTRTESGSIGIYARHEPLLALLSPTELRVTKTDGQVVRFAQGEGYVQISPGRVLLLVEEAIDPAQLSVEELQERLADAEARAAQAAAESEELKRAERDQARAKAFLSVVRGEAA